MGIQVASVPGFLSQWGHTVPLVKKFPLSDGQKSLIREILELKKKKKAVILAHNYMRPEIFEVADVVGDSFELSKKAMATDAEIIVFAGVHFMAETAHLLNPGKKVLLPSLRAGCYMADMISAERLAKFKELHPKAGVCLYINSAASVKAIADICCTSANAVAAVESLPQDEVIFAPDENLAEYVAGKTKKKIIPWRGFCAVHTRISVERILMEKEKHPGAKIIMHPETPNKFLKYADHVCGTGGMAKFAQEDDAREYLIGTEDGMVWKLRSDVPEKDFYPLMGSCMNMKEITLGNIRESLLEGKYVVTVDPAIAEKAKQCIERMMELR